MTVTGGEVSTMSDLRQGLATYERLRSELESSHIGKWVLVHDDQLVGIYQTFDMAALDAVKKFGRGPYLIRQIGAAPVTLPASVMYGPFHEIDDLRIRNQR